MRKKKDKKQKPVKPDEKAHKSKHLENKEEDLAQQTRGKDREGQKKSRNKESWWSISLFSAIFNYPSRSKFSRSVDQQQEQQAFIKAVVTAYQNIITEQQQPASGLITDWVQWEASFDWNVWRLKWRTGINTEIPFIDQTL